MIARVLFALALCSAPLAAQVALVGEESVHEAAGGGGDPLLPYLFSEGFETATTGYENSWTETAAGGTFTPAYTTNPGAGSQSLRIESAGTSDRTFAAFTAQADVYFHFLFRYESISGTTDIFELRDTTSARLRVICTAAGVLTVQHGATVSSAVTDAIPSGTWVRIWCDYHQGGGGDGDASIGWSTTTTRPTSGTKFQSVTDGSATSTVNRVYLGSASGSNETFDIRFDDVWGDEVGFPQP